MKSSTKRLEYGASCEVRNDLWDLLVNLLPNAFSPKGTSLADTLAAFSYLTNNSGFLFSSTCTTKLSCNSGKCSTTQYMSHEVGVISYHADLSNNDIGIGLETFMRENAYSNLFAGENNIVCKCNAALSKTIQSFNWSDIIMVDIPCDNVNIQGQLLRSRNVSQTTINESILITGIEYVLVGAVQNGEVGGHFISIVKHENGNGYKVLDDLRTAESFLTFGGAVTRNAYILEEKWCLRREDRGILLLVYMKKRLVSKDALEYQHRESLCEMSNTNFDIQLNSSKPHQSGLNKRPEFSPHKASKFSEKKRHCKSVGNKQAFKDCSPIAKYPDMMYSLTLNESGTDFLSPTISAVQCNTLESTPMCKKALNYDIPIDGEPINSYGMSCSAPSQE